MAESRIEVGIIGCGSVAQLSHLPSIGRSTKFHLAAVCDPKLEVAESTAERWGAEHAYADYRTMLEKARLDAVVISSPNAFHFEQAFAAIQSGRHVYIEKPMTATNRQAWDLVKEARTRGLVVTIGCHQRFYLQHRWAKQLIEEGVIGEVHLVRTSLHETWHLYQENVAKSDFRMRADLSVAGTVFDQGSHRADLLLWLMGQRPTRVVGIAENVASPDLDGPIDDLAIATIGFGNGAYGVLTVDKFSPVVSNITEIYGTEGMIFASSEVLNPFQSVPLAVYTARDYSWDELPDIIRNYRYPIDFWVTDLVRTPLAKRWVSIIPPRVDPFFELMEDFGRSIQTGVPPAITAEDGAYVMEVLCGIFRSMETRSWVDLPMGEEARPPFWRSPA
jgi:predicted dehydrogenase